MTRVDVAEWIALAAACSALAGAAYKATRAVKADWEQRRTREVQIDGTLAGLVANLAIVKKEVTTNGGGSLKDSVLEQRAALEAQRIALGTEIAARRINEKAAMWEGVVRADGVTVPSYVSPAWVRLTGLVCEETANGGWVRCVLPADRERVLKEADEANRQSRPFEATYTIRNVLTGLCTTVHHIGMPVHDSQGRLRSWIGLATPLTEEGG